MVVGPRKRTMIKENRSKDKLGVLVFCPSQDTLRMAATLPVWAGVQGVVTQSRSVMGIRVRERHLGGRRRGGSRLLCVESCPPPPNRARSTSPVPLPL